MNTAALRSALPWFGLALAIIALDLGTKWWALSALDYDAPERVLPVLNWTLRYNTGAAFSFLAGAGGWQRWLFTALALGVSAVLGYWLLRRPPRVEAIAYAAIMGGALGNLYDRLRHGHVVDFIELHAAGYYWPAFNIADVAICVGAGLLLLYSFIGRPSAHA